MGRRLSILIADDHPMMLRGLKATLGADESLEVVGEAADGRAALALIGQVRPDVAVLDINMPVLDGFGVARSVLGRLPGVEIVFLTMHDEPEMLRAALDLGVKGYLLKESAAEDVVACVKSVAAGRAFITPSLSSLLLERRRRAGELTERRPGLLDLSPTERIVLRLVAGGKESKEIAAELSISYRTVETHRSNIARKLGLHGHNAVTKFALEHKSEL
jgi:DNA-binding NarL/FixJ family response regulator